MANAQSIRRQARLPAFPPPEACLSSHSQAHPFGQGALWTPSSRLALLRNAVQHMYRLLATRSTTKLDKPVRIGMKIDSPKYIGGKFRNTRSDKAVYYLCEVELDPNTTHRALVASLKTSAKRELKVTAAGTISAKRDALSSCNPWSCSTFSAQCLKRSRPRK